MLPGGSAGGAAGPPGAVGGPAARRRWPGRSPELARGAASPEVVVCHSRERGPVPLRSSSPRVL